MPRFLPREEGWPETCTSPLEDRAPEPHKGDDGLVAKAQGRHSPGDMPKARPLLRQLVKQIDIAREADAPVKEPKPWSP